MSIMLIDEHGESIEVDGPQMMEIITTVSKLSMACAVESVIGSQNDRRTVKYVNDTIARTWGNDQWCVRIIHYIFDLAKKGPKDA